MKKFIIQYLYNWAVLASQALSVLLGGHPDDSLSERTGRAYKAKPRSWFAIQRFLIDLVIFVATKEKNHCINAINDEPRAKQLWNWEK